MGDLDDRLRHEFQRASGSVGAAGVLERLTKRRRARQLRTKLSVSVLSLALAGSAIAGVYLSRGEPDPIAAGGGGGVIVFTRTLRDCSSGVVATRPRQLFAVTPDGKTEWNLSKELNLQAYSGDVPPLASAWLSGDGSRLAWADSGTVAVIDIATGERWDLPFSFVRDVVFSPDNRRVAVQAIARAGDVGDPEIEISLWTASVDGSEPPTRLTDPPSMRNLPTFYDELPTWSPDGQTIAFIRTHVDEPPGGSGLAPTREALMFVNADGSNLREIERQPDDGEFDIKSADWAPDGTRFVAEAQFGMDADLFVANIDGRTGYRLTDHPEPDRSGTWSPDGSLIAFQTGRWGRGQGHSEIAIVDPSGEEVRRVTDNCWDDESPVWLADASFIRLLPPWRTSATEPSPTPEPDETTGVDDPIELQGVPFPVCRPMSIEGSFGPGLTTVWVFEEERVPGAGCGDDTEGFQHVGVGSATDVQVISGQLRDFVLDSVGVWPFATPDIDGDGVDEIAVGIDGSKTDGRASIVLFRVERRDGVPRIVPVDLECGPACDPVPWIDVGSPAGEPPAGAYCGDFSEHPELGVGLMRWFVDGDRVDGALWVLKGSSLSSALEDITLGGPASTATDLSDGTSELCGSTTHWPEDFANYRFEKLTA